MQNQPQLTQISTAAFAAKFQSKNEAYNFMTQVVKAFAEAAREKGLKF